MLDWLLVVVPVVLAMQEARMRLFRTFGLKVRERDMRTGFIGEVKTKHLLIR